jgi:hypothetical protein
MKTIITTTVMLAMLANVAQALPLISEHEAKLPEASSRQTRAISRGPGIRVESPNLDEETVKSPFNLKVAFKPHGGAKINPNSIKVIYLKTPAVDLLDRLKPGISNSGIDFTNAEVPVGKHRIQVILEDSDGRESSTIIDLNVVK